MNKPSNIACIAALVSLCLSFGASCTGPGSGGSSGFPFNPCVADPTQPQCQAADAAGDGARTSTTDATIGSNDLGPPPPVCTHGETRCAGNTVELCTGDWTFSEECEAGSECLDGQCVPVACTPSCGGKECGNDGCGGLCGECQPDFSCNAQGQCEFDGCTPDCAGKECGSDGCGGQCGNCPNGWSCQVDTCAQSSCTPQCAGKECGDDTCGGSCGGCNAGESCVNFQCQGANPTGDTCEQVMECMSNCADATCEQQCLMPINGLLGCYDMLVCMQNCGDNDPCVDGCFDQASAQAKQLNLEVNWCILNYCDSTDTTCIQSVLTNECASYDQACLNN